MQEFCVIREKKTRVVAGADYLFDGVISGMGKNKGTLDSSHSRSAAYRHARMLRAENPGAAPEYRFRVETNL